MGHSFVGSRHILLAILRHKSGVGRLLRSLGMDPELTEKAASVLYGTGTPELPLPQGLSREARQILGGAAREARLRGEVWQAAFRQQLENLPTALPAGLRSVIGSLLTDLTAADLYDLTDTLTWLAKEDAAITAETVPGRYDAQSGRYDFAQDSIAFATRLFPAAEGSAATPAPSPSPAPSDPLEPEATVSPTRQP